MPGAFAELERCSARMLSGEVDESLMLERELFERDPELRAVRSTKRFQKLVERTFKEKGERGS